jgi:heme exporter protein C
MREKAIYITGGLAGIVLLLNIYNIFMVLPDEANQGAVYRILFFHVPPAITGMMLFFVAMVAGIGYLSFKDFRWDALSVAAVEVGVVLSIVNLVTGSIWGRNQWGIWWAWDARITSQFICVLIYVGYLVIRPAFNDATQRATISAVLSIFAFADIPIVWFSIRWWRTQHPGPVLETGGLQHDMAMALLYNTIGFLLLGTALMLIRLRSEEVQREIESMRRLAHAL